MQHNWWIAALELAGVWTHEEAEHVSTHIRNVIHRESYPDAVKELQAIFSRVDSPFAKEAEVVKLRRDIEALNNQISLLVAASKVSAPKVDPLADPKTNKVANVKTSA